MNRCPIFSNILTFLLKAHQLQSTFTHECIPLFDTGLFRMKYYYVELAQGSEQLFKVQLTGSLLFVV